MADSDEAEKETEQLWKRSEITSCNCSEKSYRHVHCPCFICNGQAVDRHTEFRHWNDAKIALETVNYRHCETYKLNREEVVDLCAQDGFNGDQREDEMEYTEEINSDEEEEMTDYTENQREHEMEYIEETYSDKEDETTDYTENNEECTNNENPLRKIVVNAVMDALKIKNSSGVSIETFQDILEFGKSLLLKRISNKDIDKDIVLTLWPKTWIQVQKLLKEEGYDDAELLYICFCSKEKLQTRNGQTTKKVVYSGKYSVMKNKDSLCEFCGKKGSLKYYYLGLKSKVKYWFKSKDMCNKMLAHWKDRNNWLGCTSSNKLKSELWDGDRWIELQWFWNPNSVWTLPVVCLFCDIPVPSEHILNSYEGCGGTVPIDCPNCFETFEHIIQTTRGSPLNLALVGHWDGWQPFGSSYRGCGSLEVSIANMSKVDRNHVDEVYVVGFVPSYKVPNIPEALDPFLHPLMQDICTGFINGFQITDYPSEIEIEDYHLSKTETVRVLLLCWTGDHPGQCEVGKLLNQGRCPCRRCKLTGQLLENSSNTLMYYGGNRYHFRYPWEQRSLKMSIDDMFNIEHETRISVRKSSSSLKGFTGTSILHKYLYPLYGFDILKHLVYDTFHTICLNVVKNQLERQLDLKLIDQSQLDKEIEKFPWNKDFKCGRLPTPIGKCKGTGQWKAEGLQKFAFPMADCIFMAKLKLASDKECQIQSLVSRLTEMHFNTGRTAWDATMIDEHRKLAWRLNIMVEEVQGLHMCTISLHNLLHIHEDILNFSSPDNFWCAVFERAVKQYVKKSHNCKGIESTFAHSESIREFLKPLEDKVPNKVTGKVDIQSGFASSLDVARDKCKKQLSRNSFLLGPTSHACRLQRNEQITIADALNISAELVPTVCLTSNKAFVGNKGFDGCSFSKGDSVIANSAGREVIITISHFLAVRCSGVSNSSTLFVVGSQYQALDDENGFPVRDFWSGFLKVQDHVQPDVLILPLGNIEREVILYKIDDSSLCVADYKREARKLPYQIVVPVYFEVEDMVLIQGEGLDDIWHGQIHRINNQERSVGVFFFVQSSRHAGEYVRETQGMRGLNTVHWDSVIDIAEGEWISNIRWRKL